MNPAALIIAASCSWANPGVDRFVGDPHIAVEHYADIEPQTRARLSRRIVAREYDRSVAIRRDSIEGFEPEIRDMHFGANRMCRAVDRGAWPDSRVERGMVYCEGDECVLVPVACGNVARIRPQTKPKVAAARFDLPMPSSDFVATEVPSIQLAEAPQAAPPRTEEGVEVDVPPWWAAIVGPFSFEEPPDDIPPLPSIPEPAPWLTLGGGLVAVLAAARRHSVAVRPVV